MMPALRKCLTVGAVAALFAPVTLLGQMPRSTGPVNRAPDKNATQILIPTFTTADYRDTLGVSAAEEMRRQSADVWPWKLVYIIPRERSDPMERGQFPQKMAMDPDESRWFASMLRAEEFVLGSVARTSNGGFRVHADLMLTKDADIRQSLGVGEAATLPNAIKVLVAELIEARKQMDGVKKCIAAERESRYSEAVEFARIAIAVYPKATFARACLLKALAASKPTADTIATVANDAAPRTTP